MTLGPSLRRRRRAARAWPRLVTAFAASLALNAGLIALVRVGVVHGPEQGPKRAVQVAPLSARAWEANRRVADAAPADPATRADAILAELERARPPPPPPTPPGQVVDVAPSKDATPPKDARFVAEQDSSVEKETISRHRAPGFERTAPTPSAPTAARPVDRARPPERPAEVARPERGTRGTPDATGRPERPVRRDPPAGERLALKLDRFGERTVAEPAERTPPERGGPRGDPLAAENGLPGATERGTAGALDRSKLAPSAETYDRIAGGPAPDHVTGVEEGEGTYLNAREWKYASYFNRIKQAVANTWDPARALALRDPDGRRFAYRDRHTLVSVRLDGEGSLMDVEVVKSSGVDFLDQVALDAFRKAQPFVNPPRGLADPRGEIDFTFGFYLETGGGLRMYRAPSR